LKQLNFFEKSVFEFYKNVNVIAS